MGWRRGPELMLLLAFVLTRVAARAVFGLRFDGDVLGYWHVLDLPLLRDDLARSLFYLHGQPPLYNLLLGVGYTVASDTLAPRLFEAVFLVLSYLGIVGIHALLLELGTPRRAALAAALVQAFSTTWLVYESWLFYSLPLAVLMTWAAVWLARAAAGSARSAVAYAAAVAALSWTRATYQPAFAAVALGVLLFAVRGSAPVLRAVARRSALAAALAVVLLPAKNYLLFGSFSSSTWLGMNLAHMTTDWLDDGTREGWIQAGVVSAAVRQRAFSPLADYPAELRVPPPGTPAHPALIAETKADGSPNFNTAAYVGIARLSGAAARVVMRRRPDVYLDRVRRAVRTWLRPPTDYILVVPEREALREWDRLHSRYLLWSSDDRRRAGPTLVLIPAALLFAAAVALRAPAERRRLLLLTAFPLFAIAWNFAVGNLADVEENNRFRVEVEGLIVVLGCFGLVETARLVVGRFQRASSPAGGGNRSASFTSS